MFIDDVQAVNDCAKCAYNTQIPVPFACSVDNPKFILLGQSPGAEEVIQGSPFVGPSGRLLIAELSKIHIFMNELYVTNSIKCMPFNNQEPVATSLTCCRPFLINELKTILPKCQHKLILVTGKIALKQLDPKLGKLPIDQVVGSLIHNEELDCDLFIVRHPAALLRTGSSFLRQQYQQHFQKLSSILHETFTTIDHNPEFTLIRTKEDLVNLQQEILLSDSPIALDLETTSLKPWEAKIWCFSISINNRLYVVDANILEIKDFFVALKDKKWILHNAEFDVKMIDYILDTRLNLYWDTMQAEHVLNEEGELGLKQLAVKYFNAPPYKDEIISELLTDSEKLEKVIKEDSNKLMNMYKYNAMDSYYTYLLYERQKKIFETKEEAPSYNFYQTFTIPLLNTFLDIIKLGIPINVDQLITIEKQLKGDIETSKKKLFKITHSEFNHRSLATLLKIFQMVGLKETELGKTAKGNPSLTKSDLEKLATRTDTVGEISQLILTIRNTEKLITTYVHQINEYIYSNPYFEKVFNSKLPVVSPDFKLHASTTYRTNSANPNLHNITKGSIIKKLFTPPPGYMYVVFDYVTAEGYLAGLIAKEKRLIEFVEKPDLDQHRYTASVVFNKPEETITSEERSKAKKAWFAFQYGGTEYTISRDFNMPMDDAKKIVEGIKKAYPNLFAYMDRLRDYAYQKKRLVNRFGATKRFLIWDKKSERQAINYPFQSEVSIYNHLAFIDLHKISKAVSLTKFRVLFTIHDSILSIVREDLVPIMCAIIEKIMTMPRQGIKLLVDGEVGKDWFDVTKIKEQPELQQKIDELKEKDLAELLKMLKNS